MTPEEEWQHAKAANEEAIRRYAHAESEVIRTERARRDAWQRFQISVWDKADDTRPLMRT